MADHSRELDPVLGWVGEALSYTGAEEAVERVSSALGRAGVSYGDMLLFIPIFLAFYSDTYDLDVAQLVQNIEADTRRVLDAVRRLRLRLTEEYGKAMGDSGSN